MITCSKPCCLFYAMGLRNWGIVSDLGGVLYVEYIFKRRGDLKNCTLEDVTRVVQADNKQRLSFKIDTGSQRYKIRTNHGHFMQIEGFELEPLLGATDCTFAVYGTHLGVLKSILQKGLSRMGSNHIHFIMADIDKLTKLNEVLIYLDVQKALDAGLQLFRSGYGVILCPGNHDGEIPTRSLKRSTKIVPGSSYILGNH